MSESALAPIWRKAGAKGAIPDSPHSKWGVGTVMSCTESALCGDATDGMPHANANSMIQRCFTVLYGYDENTATPIRGGVLDF